MTNAILTILLSAMAGIALFALASTLASAGKRPDQRWSLAILLFALFVHALGGVVMAAELYRFAPHLAGSEIPFRMALGPALFFYVRSMVSGEQTSFGTRDAWAFAGPALVIAISLPFLFLSAEQKLALADPLTRDPVHFRWALTACIGGVLMFIGFTAAYIARSFRLQARHRAAVKTEYANIELRSLDWLRVILIVWSGAWLAFAAQRLLWFVGWSSPSLDLGLAIVEVLALASFAHLALHQPLPVEKEEPADVARTPILANDRMARVASRLTSALQADQLFADHDLSLTRLSEVTGITKHHISETLSQHLGTNFFDFVNRLRIEEAKRLIAETDATVLEIAMEVGFNARSTFNAAFKKHTGVTPSAYRLASRAGSATNAPVSMASE